MSTKKTVSSWATRQYELDDIRIRVSYYPVDGAQVCASRFTKNEWVTMYDIRVIADSLYEMLDGALFACGVGDDARIGMLETWGVELPDDNDE
jgi:hypothetical protein